MILITSGTQPNRLISEVAKDMEYHLQFARYVGTCVNTTNLSDRTSRHTTNLKFYKGDQWILEEDLDAFFMDEEGRDLGRIKTIRNYIQPMVEQYRGTASRMVFRYNVKCMSPSAISRREEMLNRLLIYNDIGSYNPDVADRFREEWPVIGKTADDTVAMFNNLYTDEYAKKMSLLLDRTFDYNQVGAPERMMQRALDVALSGMCIEYAHPYNGEFVFDRIDPSQFAFDPNAKKGDLSDSNFYLTWEYSMPTTIYEQYPMVSDMYRKAIETYVIKGPSSAFMGVPSLGRVLTYTATWRDTCPQEYAFVVDRQNLISLQRLNFREDDNEPPYTYADVVPFTQLDAKQKKLMRNRRHNNGVITIFTDVWRFCTFIPSEELPNPADNRYFYKDLVLDYGYLPYQEPDAFVPTNMKPPYKIGTWSYVDGDVLSPVDVAINPQRLINRFESIMEQKLNSSGGSAPIIDRDALGTVDESEAVGAIKRGDPLLVNGKRMGVTNIVSRYEAGISGSTTVLASIIDNYKTLMEETTGVNAQLKGAINPDQLVGAMQMAVNQGSVIQEPFYQAIQTCLYGLAQATVTSGKRMYIDQDRTFVDFSDIVGIDGVQVLTLTEDMRMETFRAAIERTVDKNTERQEVDQLVLLYRQYGMLDPIRGNMLTGRASKSELLSSLADYAKEMGIAQKQQAEQMQQQAAAAQQQQADMAVAAKDDSDRRELVEQYNKDMDREVALATKSPTPR